MKTILSFLAAALLFSATSRAQESKVYLKAGLNLANVSTTSDGRIDNANTLASFHAGLLADLPVGKFFGVQTGLLFTGKGAKTQSGQPSDANYFKATSNPFYIELPLTFVVKVPLEVKGSEFFVGAGPYAAMGIGGRNKTEGKVFGAGFSSNDKIQFSNDDPTTFNEQEGAGFGIMRRFDFGLNATAGFALNNTLLSINYGYGLTKINSVAQNSDDKNKHRVLSFSIGFRI